jgi:hypothetical protein
MSDHPFSQTLIGSIVVGLFVTVLGGVIVWHLTHPETPPPSHGETINQALPPAGPKTSQPAQLLPTPANPSPTPTSDSVKSTTLPPPRKPRVIIVARDESMSPWTTEITTQELEMALAKSDKFTTVLSSELPQSARDDLAPSSLVDLTKLRETAKNLRARYIVIAKCLKAKEESVGVTGLTGFESSQLRAVVRIELFDEETGDIIDSQGFEGSEYTKVLGGTPIGSSASGAQGAYKVLMNRFAGQFANRVEHVFSTR